ncbi:MAG: hypothetical protein U0136_04250 [Bdellovibrionota bacterium]
MSSRCKILLALFVLPGLLSCSAGGVGSPENELDAVAMNGPLKIDVFSARGFLGGSEYERYFLNGNLLWRECGSIDAASKAPPKKPEVEGDKVLSSDPQLHIQERRVEKLTAKQAEVLRSEALSVLGKIQSAKHSEPPPGSVFSLGDPGVFEMMVAVGDKKERLISSVDAVADRSSPTLENAYSLFSKLRGIGPEICGSDTFYGIQRQKM